MSAPRCQTENPRSHRIKRMTKIVHNMTVPLFLKEKAKGMPARRRLARAT